MPTVSRNCCVSSRNESPSWTSPDGSWPKRPELIRLFGEARSELFHYEVRATYDTPELSEHRRLVDEALQAPELFPDDEDDEPWRNPPR